MPTVRIGEEAARLSVGDEFDGAEEAAAAHLAHQRMALERLAHAALQIGADVVLHARHELHALDQFEVLERHRARHRMAGIGVTVDQLLIRVGDDVAHARAERDRRDRLIAGRQSLRHRRDVGHEAVGLRAEPLADAAEAGDHFVGVDEDVVFRADLLDPAGQ